MTQPQKILVIRFKQIGDALLSLPVCNSLRQTYPDAQIDYLVYEHIAPILQGQPSIDNVLTITADERRNKFLYLKKALWLRKQGYDMVLDLINVPISALITFMSGATFTVGFDKKRWRSKLYKSTVPHADVGDTVTKKLDILKGLPQTSVVDQQWQIVIAEQTKSDIKARLQARGVDFNRPLIFVAASSRRDYKVWPTAYFVEVLNHLQSKHKAQLILNCLPGAEGEFVRQLACKLQSKEGVISDFSVTLDELPVLISNCDFFFGNDGGPSHMAVGVGVPSLAVFSPINPKVSWLPLNDARHQGVDLTDALGIDESQHEAMLPAVKQDVNGYYQRIRPELVITKLDEMLTQFIS